MTGPETKIASAILKDGESAVSLADPFHTDMVLSIEKVDEDLMLIQENDGADSSDIIMLTPYLGRELYLILKQTYGE